MKWIIHSKESPTECYLRLAAITDPSNAPFLYTESRFCGTVYQDSFEILFCDRPTSFQMRIYPFKIKGRFVETESGTDIVLRFGPHFLPRQLWWLLPSAAFVLLVFFIALYESFERLGRILAIVLALLCLIAFFSLGVIPAALCALKILKSTFR